MKDRHDASGQIRLVRVGLPGVPPRAWRTAQEWPAKPVKIVVPFSPGGSSDQLARLLAPELSATFGQQFYIENRGGSSGAIGAAQVAKSAPDGYTLVNAGSGPHLTGPAINPNVGYDPLKDFTHIAMLAADSYVLVANPALGAKSIADLVQIGRGRHLTSSSPGAGSLGHLILERFKRSAKLNIQHVPSPNSGMQDVLGNHINLTFTTLLTAGLQIRGGLLVPLAVTSPGATRPIPTSRPSPSRDFRMCAAIPGSGSPARAGFRRSWCSSSIRKPAGS